MTFRPFPRVPRGYPFPELELGILARWKEERVFERSLERTRGGPPAVFYEGPPTANNVPHVGHVMTRIVKDLFPRYHTMRGRYVARKAGWDTHGLPVEIEVEKRLGFTHKRQIEEFGIERFNRACLESVHRYEEQWRRMSERVGYWMDFDHAYFTYANDYIESVWWALERLWERGLLIEDYKIQPYCARCGTTLSSHEVAQNYKETDDPSVWVLFDVRPGQTLPTLDGGNWSIPPDLRLTAWTTTPWTLPAHVGLAVHPDRTYRVVEYPVGSGRYLLFGDDLARPVPADERVEGRTRRLDLRELPVAARVRGEALQGLRYDRPFRVPEPDRTYQPPFFDPPPSDEDGWRVLTADYVTAAEGTGLVHTSPPFGEDDYRSGLRYKLPFYLTVDAEGRIRDREGLEDFAGLAFKEADPAIARSLRERGLLLHAERHRHSYPFCWRCDQPLLYYAHRSWFVRTSEPGSRQRLIALNREIAWHPAHVGEGRFGKWLENVVDWALSRKRYWGTPLPVWRCAACGETEIVGSYETLFARAGREPPADPYDRGQFDPHRPYIDRYTWSCACGGAMRRVDDVIDAWFDSGAMPFAQHHYLGKATPDFDPERGVGFPAEFIAEAVDQTRGWFYTLHVLATLLFDSVAYRHCVVLGHVNDEQGRKMSKRLGNVVEPMAVLEKTGADALRWYFCVNNPELSSRFSARLVREAAQGFLLPLWNALSFFTIYANLDAWAPGEREVPLQDRPLLDRWILYRLDALTREVTAHLDGYRVADAARAVEAFLDDLTNWYIRRSRERFWAPREGAGEAKESAYQTLYRVLTTLARLLAPFTPFVADALHDHLERSRAPEEATSVHLEPWPEPSAEITRQREMFRPESASEGEIPRLPEEEGMWLLQRLVRLGLAARNTHGLKVRQPLGAVTVVSKHPFARGLLYGERDAAEYDRLLREELNVKRVEWAGPEEQSRYVRYEVRPVYPRCGPVFGPRMGELKRALEGADGERIDGLKTLGLPIPIELGDEEVTLEPDMVEVRPVEREGHATARDHSMLVALDTVLTDDLVAEGRAREVVHRVQTARKDADLDYDDRIRVRYRAAPELEEAISAHRDWIAGETLAVDLTREERGAEDLRPHPVDDLEFALAIDNVTQP